MKNTLVLIVLCLIFTSIAHAQKLCDTLFNKDTTNYWLEEYSSYYRVYDASDKSKGRKPYRDYYKTGELSAQGYYLTIEEDSTVFDGEQIHYYKNGKINSRIFFSDNMQHKKVITFYQNGNKAIEYQYTKKAVEVGEPIYDENDEIIGLKNTYYTEIPIFDGIKAIYDTVGRMILGGEYINGERNGKWMMLRTYNSFEYIWFDSWNIDCWTNPIEPYTFIGSFTDKGLIFEIDDLMKAKNGYYIVHYSNGLLNGICKLYTDKGEDTGFTLNYKNGCLDGYQIDEGDSSTIEDLFENGKFIKETHYDNKGNIKWILDREDGKTRKTIFLSETENLLISKISFQYETNIFFPDAPFERIMKDAFWEETIASDITKEGKYQMFDRYNRLFGEGEYIKDKNAGDWFYYYHDQGIYEKRVYKDSVLVNTRVYTSDNKPFTGTRTIIRLSESNDEQSTVIISVKDAIIKEIRYLNPETEKVYKVVKYQNGLPK